MTSRRVDTAHFEVHAIIFIFWKSYEENQITGNLPYDSPYKKKAADLRFVPGNAFARGDNTNNF